MYQNVYRRSLSSGPNPKTPACAECPEIKTRKDSAVHVSLSSSKLVKQPDAETSPSPGGRKFVLISSKVKVIRLCSEEHQRPEGSEPLDLPEEGSNPLFQNNLKAILSNNRQTIRQGGPSVSCKTDAPTRRQIINRNRSAADSLFEVRSL